MLGTIFGILILGLLVFSITKNTIAVVRVCRERKKAKSENKKE